MTDARTARLTYLHEPYKNENPNHDPLHDRYALLTRLLDEAVRRAIDTRPHGVG